MSRSKKLPADVLTFLKANATYQLNGDWGPNPVMCRWCDCWLYSISTATLKLSEIHDGAHKKDCFAVKYLGASTEPRKRVECTCKRWQRPGREWHERTCDISRIPNHVEPYLEQP